ncbi:MAG: hypothetical protein Q8O99_03865 [bacterium]|nr:hypothetical protein [bacterium]
MKVTTTLTTQAAEGSGVATTDATTGFVTSTMNVAIVVAVDSFPAMSVNVAVKFACSHSPTLSNGIVFAPFKGEETVWNNTHPLYILMFVPVSFTVIHMSGVKSLSGVTIGVDIVGASGTVLSVFKIQTRSYVMFPAASTAFKHKRSV